MIPFYLYMILQIGVQPGQFLTKLEGFEAPNPLFSNSLSPEWEQRTLTRDQTIEKVNKRKLTMVR